MPADTTDDLIHGARPRPPTGTTSSASGGPLHAHRLVLAAAAAVIASSAFLASQAGAVERVVHPSDSIQAAVDAARPGDTIRVAPGTYHETITITTDRISLVGSGPDKTHIVPAAQAGDPCAAQAFGVCIVGQLDDNDNVIRPVDGVRLSNLSVSGFAGTDQTGEPTGSGVFVLGAHDTTIDHVVAADNGVAGFTSIATDGDRYLDDTAHNNGFAGIQVAESAGPGHKLQDVVAYGNRYGLFVLGASGGVVDANLHDNCLGALFFGHHTSRWEMTRTTLHNNNRVCPALAEGDPASSGGGVAVIGADHVTIRLSTVTANRPHANSAWAGGIIVGSTPGGDDRPTNITVTRNEAERNGPADLVWDGTGTGISFTRNDCETSTPAGLCS